LLLLLLTLKQAIMPLQPRPSRRRRGAGGHQVIDFSRFTATIKSRGGCCLSRLAELGAQGDPAFFGLELPVSTRLKIVTGDFAGLNDFYSLNNRSAVSPRTEVACTTHVGFRRGLTKSSFLNGVHEKMSAQNVKRIDRKDSRLERTEQSAKNYSNLRLRVRQVLDFCPHSN
jgi:hypothetical protein